MSASYVLVIHAPAAAPKEREVSQNRLAIGREVGDLVLPDPGCSSSHAEILFDGTSVTVRDLQSTNGTWQNGQRITEIRWAPGTTLQIGGYYLTLKEIRAPQPAAGRTVAIPQMAAVPQAPPQGGMPQQPPAPAGYAQPGHGHHAPAAPAQHGPAPGAAPHAAPAGAKKKSSALVFILVGAFLLGTCTVIGGGLLIYASRDKGGASTSPGGTAPQLSEAREATVQFVWFAGEPGPEAKGGTAPARIRVGPNKTGTVSVGVAEEFAGGGGNQWRTATWLAAFNASRTMGASLADYEFNVHVGGHTDGPSAGMLTTVAMLALMREKDLRPDSTMTGTINPDGTAGPVGGIVQKMEGAKASGLKRFGFPIGCRNHKDMKTGNDVDLMTVGQTLGLEVQEIGDLYQGYEFMTGDKLDRVEPIAENELEPDPKTQSLLRAKLMAWKARVDREIGGLKQEAGRTGKAVQAAGSLLGDADKAYDKAKRYERNGYLVPALEGYAETAITVATATRLTNAVSQIAAHNLNGLLDAVKTAQNVKPEVQAFGQQLEVRAQSKTRGGQLSAAAAYHDYVTAAAATMIGDDFLDGAVNLLNGLKSGTVKPTREVIEALMLKVMIPTLYYDTARVYLDYAKDTQDLIVDEGSAKPIPGADIDRAVAGYASASAAVLAYFDALIVDEVAKQNAVSADEARVVIAQREPEYYLARKANLLSEYTGKPGEDAKESSDGKKLMRLAAASSAYLGGAKLVNKWYSLSGHVDKQGNLLLENRRALTAQLDLAKQSAREAAARAKKGAGFVPGPAKLAYQKASAEREGSDDEKLGALAAYWQSTFWSELAANGH